MAEDNWLSQIDGLELKPCDFKPDLGDTKRFVQLKESSAVKMQISSLIQHSPAIAAIGASSDIYIATFPEGIPHVLEQFADGSGYYSAVRGEKGQYIAQARLNPVGDIAVVASVFTVMSIVTSQYYLSAINGKLNQIQRGINEILGFLYGDKQAELMSEVVFSRYAFENFNSIMLCPEQRTATIAGLQSTKKIAMKDLEFYISDLDALSDTFKKDIPGSAKKALQLKDCLELSMQLYAMSGISEAYYSRNNDEDYISYVEQEMTSYVNKSESHILRDFAKMINPILANKNVEQKDKDSLKSIMEDLSDGKESKLSESIKTTLHAAEQDAEYYITKDGEMYLKKA